MPRHTAVLIYSMLRKKKTLPKRVKPNRGNDGSFIYFTVLKDVRDTMNLSALPTSCSKNCTSSFFFPYARSSLFSFPPSS